MNAKIRTKVRGLILDTIGPFATPSKGVHLMNSHLLTLGESLNSDFFDNQLKKISQKSTIIPFGEAVELINKRSTIKSSVIAFSYDDGFAECHSHIAPVLEKYNGLGCFFVNPNFVEGDKEYVDKFLQNIVHLPNYKKPMNWTQIADLHARGHIIGAHTMDHERVSSIVTKKDIEYQIGASKRIIEHSINSSCNHFAFPYGHPERDFNIKLVEIAESYYKYNFSASNWRRYFSYDGRVFNRRHCEPYWNANHINYFLSKQIQY